MDSKKTSNTIEQGQSRRGFIKKTSLVAGVSMIPASNVWGACNVSGVSGGSSTTIQTCTIAAIIGGHPASIWNGMTQTDTAAYHDNIANIVTIGADETFTNSGTNKREFYYEEVRSFLNDKSLYFVGISVIPTLNINVGSVLNSGVNQKQLYIAALYANIALGFAALPAQYTGSSGLDDYLEHVWGALHINPSTTISTINSGLVLNTINEATLASKLM